MGRARATAYAGLLASLTGCPAPYSAPPSFDPSVAVNVGELTYTVGLIGSGDGRAPRSTSARAARCVDENVCEAAVVDGLAVVGGIKPGTTELVLESFDSRMQASSRVHIAVTVLPTRDGLLHAGGKMAPEGDLLFLTGVKPADGGEPIAYSCAVKGALEPEHHDSSDPTGGELGRSSADVFRCMAPVTLPSGRHYWLRPERFQRIFWPTPERDEVLACLDRIIPGGEIRALWVYRRDKRYRLELLDKRGTPGRTCSPPE